ncbi:MAG: glycosyltransferase family 2 protein [Candidatus Omnitrophica bacterium]|nr:glycosyltransferase family 2 protein [Candidatus Omnitrophota bacterium]
MPKKDFYSIVIPVYNGSRTLRKTLESVRRQEDDDFEIVVVDDASTEELRPLIEEMGALYHRLPENSGPATARTAGVAAAKGQIVVFTDSDVWLPDHLIGNLRKVFSETGAECVQGSFSKHCPHPNFYSQYKNLYNHYVINQLGDWINTTYTSLTAVQKGFFLKGNGFDRNIRAASVEDRTLGESLISAGGKIYLAKRLEVVHDKFLDAKGFYRSQFNRSRDLAKLMQRQKESKFLEKGKSFGTNTRAAMLRLPVVALTLVFLFLGLIYPPLWLLALISFAAYCWLTRNWISFLKKNKGWWFALRGQFADFTDAIATGLGVAMGMFEYRVLGRRY